MSASPTVPPRTSQFHDTIRFFSIFRHHLGRRLYAVVVLRILASATEGFGIALLLPLLLLLDVGHGGAGAVPSDERIRPASGFERQLHGLLERLGIEGSLPGVLLFIGAVFVIQGAIRFASGGYAGHLKAQLMTEVRIKLLAAYASMDYRYYSRHNAGHFVHVVNAQTQEVLKAFTHYNHFLAAWIAAAASFVFAFLISWPFAMMAVLAGGGILLVFRRLNRHVRAISRSMAAEGGRLNHLIVQTMQAFKYLSATHEIEPLRRKTARSVRELAGDQRKQGIAEALTESLRDPLSVAALVAIILVQILVLNAAVGPILVALVLIYRAMGQLVMVQVSWQKSIQHIGSIESVENEIRRAAINQEPSGRRVLGPLQEGIELNRVSFAYNPGAGNVLHDITLRIPANRTVALVGGSGAGKSTLADLLTLVLRPTSGELLVDGVPHPEIELRSWREQIGYVSQETVVFDDTIVDNISLWRGDYETEPEVRRNAEQAAVRACADEFIDALPAGYLSRVGDRGIRLSGGQRQRLFVARELYKNPRLLILDEATSALDSHSERVIQQSVDQLRGSMTVVIISHRLSTIRNADYIYVLERGRIVQQGSYDELVAVERGTFRRMVELQQL
jgi:ABC-type multidrug transport system fused ATPase/permease subunit